MIGISWARDFKYIALAVASSLVISLVLPAIAAAFSGTGKGTAGNPYKVGSCAQLQAVADDLDAHYLQTGNIDCSATQNWNSSTGFDPIGESGSKFTGTYNGQNFTINDLYINQTDGSIVGLFAFVEDAAIKNIHLRGGSVTSDSGSASASLIADADNTTIESCSSTIDVTGLRTSGLLGYINNGTTVNKCWYKGDVNSGVGSSVYGYNANLVGGADDSTLTNVYAQGTLSYDGPYNGSLAGYLDNGSSITNAYSTVDVTSRDNDAYVSALIGRGSLTSSSSVNQVFFSGDFDNGGSSSGGIIVGLQDGLNFTNTYYEDTTCGNCDAAVGSFSSGLTSWTEVDDPSDFVGNSTNAPMSAWDFDDVWRVTSGGYPTLRIASTPSDGDSDGASGSIESAAPNGGDANNDGTLDAVQTNVTSFMNSVSGKYATLGSTCDSTDNVAIVRESSNGTQDTQFNYPLGLMVFTLNCNTPGETATITLHVFYDDDPGNVVARKYNRNSGTYSAIPEADISKLTVGGEKAVKIVYEVTDGGSLDEDGTVNGVIVDPTGLAVIDTSSDESVGVPNTGTGGLSTRQ